MCSHGVRNGRGLADVSREWGLGPIGIGIMQSAGLHALACRHLERVSGRFCTALLVLRYMVLARG
jgi:hypothetical protein